MDKIKKIIFNLLLLLIPLAFFVINCGLVTYRGEEGDVFYPILFFRDVFINHFDFLKWIPSPAPYYLPDQFLFHFFSFLLGTENPNLIINLVIISQNFLFFGAIYYIFTKIIKIDKKEIPRFKVFLATLFIFFSTQGGGNLALGYGLMGFAMPMYHFGNVINSLFIFILLNNFFKKRSFTTGAVTYILAFLFFLSDALFLLTGVMPCVFLLIVDSCKKKETIFLKIRKNIFCFLAFLILIGSYILVHGKIFPYTWGMFGLRNLNDIFKVISKNILTGGKIFVSGIIGWWNQEKGLINSNSILVQGIVCLLIWLSIISFVLLIFYIFKHRKKEEKESTFLVFLWVSSFFNLFFGIMLDFFGGIGLYRYYFIFFIFPLLYLIFRLFVGVQNLKKNLIKDFIIFILLLAEFSSLNIFIIRKGKLNFALLYPYVAQYLDENKEKLGLEDGVGDWGYAKVVSLYSKKEIYVADFLLNLQGDTRIIMGSRDKYFYEDSQKIYPRKYNFVLMSNVVPDDIPNFDKLEKLFGKFSERININCNDYSFTLFVYDHDLRPALLEYFGYKESATGMKY